MTSHERHRRRAGHRHPARHALELAGAVYVTCFVIATLVAVGWLLAVVGSAPSLSDLTARATRSPTVIYAADGSLLGYAHSAVVFEYVSPNRIPQTLKEATVAIEDRRFWQHGAVDFRSIVRAAHRRGSHPERSPMRS